MIDSQNRSNGVPRLSMAALSQPHSRADFIARLWQALADYGFVVICDHGIAPAKFTRAYDLAEQLFAQPLAIKQGYELGGGHRGYVSFGKETAKDCEFPDLKEFWHIGPEWSACSSAQAAPFPDNVWPEDPLPEFRPFFQTLHRELTAVAEALLTALAEAMQLPDSFFSELIARGNSVQRLIHYPALAAISRAESISAEQSVRAAAHADINLMTLLIGATDSGLQLLDKNGQWLPVENQSNDLVVDTGDMMALLTNNALPATVHRVVNPKDTSRPRYSIPFFVHPGKDALLAPLAQFVDASRPAQFEPITAGDFLAQRLRENGF